MCHSVDRQGTPNQSDASRRDPTPGVSPGTWVELRHDRDRSAGPALRRARFAELTPFEVYGLCRLRVDVFVVEQECPYPELDGRDAEPATVHLWFEEDGEVLATIRVLDDGDDPRDRPRGDRGVGSAAGGWPRG